MVIHYSASPEAVGCGRTGSSLNTTSDASQVSCKLCLRSIEKKANEPVRKTPSLAELRAAAKAAKPEVAVPNQVRVQAAKPDVSARVKVAKPIPTLTARAEWLKRLQQLPGRNRLPRGISGQSFI